jgi:hypothetical protein
MSPSALGKQYKRYQRYTGVTGSVFAMLLAAASTASADPNAEAPPLPAPPPPTHSDTSCRLDAHEGIDDADARTAALLVCSEIARLNPPPDAHYHVTLGKLGSIIILSVTREGDTPAVTADVRELRLRGIEEAAVAAPRLADSIVHGTPIAETEKFDNLVGQETHGAPKKGGGSVHFSLGVVGELPPLDQGFGPAPGLSLRVHYETKSWEIGGDIRFGNGQVSDSSPEVGFFMAELGGRYFFNETDVTPFLGAGIGWDYLNLKIPSLGFQGDNSGLGAFAEAGVEFLRTYHTHLSVGFRLDLPFFSINGYENDLCLNNLGSTSTNVCSGYTTYYYAPVSLELRLTF